MKHDLNREQRMAAVRRWVEHIESEPVDVWGPQQYAIVDGQLDAARRVAISVEHQLLVKSLAKESIAERDGDSSE